MALLTYSRMQFNYQNLAFEPFYRLTSNPNYSELVLFQ